MKSEYLSLNYLLLRDAGGATFQFGTSDSKDSITGKPLFVVCIRIMEKQSSRSDSSYDSWCDPYGHDDWDGLNWAAPYEGTLDIDKFVESSEFFLSFLRILRN